MAAPTALAALVTLGAHIVAMAIAAKLINQGIEGESYDCDVNPALGLATSWNLIGFAVAAGSALYDLLTSLTGKTDAGISFGLSCVAAAAGLIELGFAAKAADKNEVCPTVDDKVKAVEAFGIIAGGCSVAVFLLKLVLSKNSSN